MNSQSTRNALAEYQNVGTETTVACADPHQLIQLMMERALAKIAAAKGHMARGDVAEKGLLVGGAISIVDGLRSSLNVEEGGALAENLEGLYFYMIRRLLTANLENNPDVLDEVSGLLRQLKDAWDAIAQKPDNATAAAAAPAGSGPRDALRTAI